MTLALASQIIGFISFSITLATLLGVYSDLLRTLRGAATGIPLALGNLREELQYEQLYVRQKRNFDDPYDVFPDTKASSKRRRHEFTSLIEQTLQHLWKEFCDLERPFIVDGESPFYLTMEDGNNNLQHVFSYDEKLPVSRRRRSYRQPPRRDSYRRNRLGMIEAGLSADRSTYYRTDLAARFLWWFRSDEIGNLGEQIQRIQLRRIERDVYETNELVRRSYRLHCRQHGWDPQDGDNGSESDLDNRGGSGSDDGGGPGHLHHRTSRNNAPTSRHPHRKRRSNGDTSLAPGERDYSEREIIRRRAHSSERSPSRQTSRPATRQTMRQRTGSVVYEYEVVNPGRIYVESVTPRDDRERQRSRQRSYSRDRD